MSASISVAVDCRTVHLSKELFNQQVINICKIIVSDKSLETYSNISYSCV